MLNAKGLEIHEWFLEYIEISMGHDADFLCIMI